MRNRLRCLLILAVCLSGPGPQAQEGHPLAGTWAGDWGTDTAKRTHLTVVMTWDGKTIAGLINPGPDAAALTRVSVNWATWTVRVEATAKDSSGTAIPIVADARLEDIGSSRRRLVGTWTQGNTTGTVRLIRE